MQQVIAIALEAPTKPILGQPCNGCGVCCAAEPCPIGVLVSRSTTGRCAALTWQDEPVPRYVCGVVSDAQRFLPSSLRALARPMSRLAQRFISAGTGCDSDAQALD
jgi:predicted molibdopterin-dependent oxidoreductase YjgC